LDVIRLLILGIGLVGFTFGDAFNIGRQIVPMNLVGPIQVRDVALLLVLSASALSGGVAALKHSPMLSVAFVGAMIAFSAVGILNGNRRNDIADDLRVWLWLVGGAAFFQTLAANRCVLGGLLAASILFCLLMHLGAAYPMATLQIASAGERAYDSHVFNYSLVLSIIAPLFFFLGGLRSWIWNAVATAFVFLIVHDAVILGATRSIAVSMAALVAFTIPSLWKVSAIQSGRTSARLRMRLTAIAMALTCVALVLVCLGRVMTSRSAIAERFASPQSAISNEGRIEEAMVMTQEFSLEEWLVGRGFGGMTSGPGNLYMASGLHIGVLTFLLKGGVIVLAISLVTFYVALPLRYAAAWLRRPARVTPKDVGVMCITPGIAGWLVMLAMSGGYSVYASFGVGVCLAAYGVLRSQGPSGLLGFAPWLTAQHNGTQTALAAARRREFSLPLVRRHRGSLDVPRREAFNKTGQEPACRNVAVRPFSKRAGPRA